MTKGNTIPSAAPPTDEQTRALCKFYSTWTVHLAATAEAAKVQSAYVDEVNALPLPELMQGPAVIVTDADSLTKVESVLRMSASAAPDAEAVIARRLGEVRRYREQKAEIAARLKPDEIGAAALDAVQAADASLNALLAVDDPEDAILRTAWADFMSAQLQTSLEEGADMRAQVADAVLFAAVPSTLGGVLIKLKRFLLLDATEDLLMAFAEGDRAAVKAWFESGEPESAMELISVAADSLETITGEASHGA